MANYKIISTAEDVIWPAYVSTVHLKEQEMKSAEKVLEKALVTLEAYGGPHFIIRHLITAKKTSIFLYKIICDLEDSNGEIEKYLATILNEPWMKANSIAIASFELVNDGNIEKLVIKRKKSIKYYKDNEMMYEEKM